MIRFQPLKALSQANVEVVIFVISVSGVVESRNYNTGSV